MTMVAATLFRDALLGLQFLHTHEWLHGDVKPQNIGIVGTPPRAVLLDLGSAIQADSKSHISATPGRGGTVHYLAPEREMQGYDHLADIWGMGVIGYELTYGHHPWQFAINPWRPGKSHEQLRQPFNLKYEKAMALLSDDHQRAISSQTAAESKEYLQRRPTSCFCLAFLSC